MVSGKRRKEQQEGAADEAVGRWIGPVSANWNHTALRPRTPAEKYREKERQKGRSTTRGERIQNVTNMQ